MEMILVILLLMLNAILVIDEDESFLSFFYLAVDIDFNISKNMLLILSMLR